MISPARLAEIRRVIEEAPIVPPAPEPWCEAAPEPEPVRLGKLPISLFGVAASSAGENLERYGVGDPVFLYEDINGVHRALGAGSHDHCGIRSLFAGEEWRLPQLWPGRRRSWSPVLASEELIARQGRIGVVRLPAGIALAETPDDRRFRSELGRIVRRLLIAGRGPRLVLDLARAWNGESRAPRPASEIIAVVHAVCGAVLRAERAAHGR